MVSTGFGILTASLSEEGGPCRVVILLEDFSVLFGKTLEALSTELHQAEHQQQHSSFDNCSAELVQPLRQQVHQASDYPLAREKQSQRRDNSHFFKN